MENRETVIRQAYEKIGLAWDQIKDHIDEDAYYTGNSDILNDYQFHKSCPLGCTRKGKWANRPKTLKGIETNNGWTQIFSAKDLPQDPGRYWFYSRKGEESIIHIPELTDKEQAEFVEKFIGWQPCQSPKKMLYYGQ